MKTLHFLTFIYCFQGTRFVNMTKLLLKRQPTFPGETAVLLREIVITALRKVAAYKE